MTPTYNSFLPSSNSKNLALCRDQLSAVPVLHWLWPGQLCTAPAASNWGKHPLRPQKKGQNVDVPDTTLPYIRKLLNPRNSSFYEFALPTLISWHIFWPVSWWGQFSCTPVTKSPVHRLCASQKKLSGSKMTSLFWEKEMFDEATFSAPACHSTWDASWLKQPGKS